MVRKGVYKRSVEMSVARMDYHAGFLVQHKDVIVLMHYIQRDILRKDLKATSLIWHDERHHISRTDDIVCLYDLIVDTSAAPPEIIAERIIASFEEWKGNREYKAAFISPERLFYPDDEPMLDKVTGLANMLDMCIDIPEVKAVERDGEFFVTGGVESALAYGFNFSDFVPVTLVRGEIDEKSFTKMKNNL